MSDQFVGEIRPFSFNFAPSGWALCGGQTIPIIQNQALFALIGTTFGGDGKSTFQLPDLQGRTPYGYEPGGSAAPPQPQGTKGGSDTVTLLFQQMPSHQHSLMGVNAPGSGPVSPTGEVPANVAPQKSAPTTPHFFYAQSTALQALNSGTIGNAGGSQGHPNVQPSLAINFSIALTGFFPPRN